MKHFPLSCILAAFLTTLSFAEQTPSVKIEMTAQEADIQGNAALLSQTLPAHKMVVAEAVANYYEQTQARGSNVDLGTMQLEINSVIHETERFLNSRHSPYSYSADFPQFWVEQGKAVAGSTEKLASEFKVFDRQLASRSTPRGVRLGMVAGVAGAAIGISDMMVQAHNHIHGPNEQINAQLRIVSIESRRMQVAERVARLGLKNPEFALAWERTELGRDSGVKLNATSSKNIKANQHLFTTPRIAKMYEMYESGFDRSTGTFKINQSEVREALKAETNAISQAVAQQVINIQRKEANKAAVIEINYQAASSSIYLMSKVLSTVDPKAARVLAGAGNATLQISRAIDAYKAAKALGSSAAGAVNLVAGIAGAVDGLMSAILGAPDIHQIILEEIRAVRGDIANLRREMHDRFNQIDERLDHMLGRFDVCFATLETKLTLVSEDVKEIKLSLGEIDRVLASVHRNLGLTMRDGFNMPVEENITRCLESPTASMTFETYNRCLLDIKTYAVRHASNQVSTIRNPEALSPIINGDVTPLYASISRQLEDSLWRDINTLATFHQVRFGTSITTGNGNQGLPNADELVRHSKLLVAFINRTDSFAKHPRPAQSSPSPTAVVNSVMESTGGLKTAITQFSKSDSLAALATDYEILLVNLEKALQEERRSFEKENGELSVAAPEDKPTEIPLRGNSAANTFFISQNRKVLRNAYDAYASFEKVRACPAHTHPPEAKYNLELDMLPDMDLMIPNIYRVAVQRGLGGVYMCWDLIEWNTINNIESFNQKNFNLDFEGLLEVSVAAYFRGAGGDKLISRRLFRPSNDLKQVWKRTVYKSIVEGTLIRPGAEEYFDYLSKPGADPVWVSAAKTMWAAQSVKTSPTATSLDKTPAEETKKVLEDVTSQVKQSMASYKNDFRTKVELWLSGGDASQVTRLSNALRGVSTVLRSYITLALPETSVMNDELNQMLFGQEANMLPTPKLIAKEVDENFTRFKSYHATAAKLKQIVTKGRYPSGEPLSPSREMHVALEQSTVALRLLKTKLEAESGSRVEFDEALKQIQLVLQPFSSTR